MGRVTRQLQNLERTALTNAVLSECRRVCSLLGMENPTDVAACVEEALFELAHPEAVEPITPAELERAREDMIELAHKRGDDPETARVEIEAFLSAWGPE